MYYNNSDIASNVPGLQDSMREFCKAEGCRWKLLCEHFSCDVELCETSHDCCDNCHSRCTCGDCELNRVFEDELVDEKESSHLSTDSQINTNLKNMLCQYFEAENLCTRIPTPSIYTGLTNTLATCIAKDYVYLQNVTSILARFPHLQHQYAENIAVIITTVSGTTM